MKFKAIILGLILTVCMSSWTYTYVYTYVYADTCVHTYNGKEVNDKLVYYVGGDGAYYLDGEEKVYIYSAADNIVPFKAMGNSQIPAFDEEGTGVGYYYCEKCHTLIILSIKQSEVTEEYPYIEDVAPSIDLEAAEDAIKEIKEFSNQLWVKVLAYAGPAIAALFSLAAIAWYIFKKIDKIIELVGNKRETELVSSLIQMQKENAELRKDIKRLIANVEGRKDD